MTMKDKLATLDGATHVLTWIPQQPKGRDGEGWELQTLWEMGVPKECQPGPDLPHHAPPSLLRGWVERHLGYPVVLTACGPQWIKLHWLSRRILVPIYFVRPA